MFQRFTLAMVLCLLVGVAASHLSVVKTASGKGKPPKNPPDTGVIYYAIRDVDGIYSMAPDGGNQTLVLQNLPHYSEPSLLRHGGERWFLTALPIEGEFYPDGNPRFEVYAVSDGGTKVQVSNDPALQPFDNYGHPGEILASTALRWSLDDYRVSWLARRWGVDPGTGAPVVLDVGCYAVVLDSDISTWQGPAVPSRLPVEIPSTGSVHGRVPDTGGMDWSPDGQRFVFKQHTNEALYVADLREAGSVTEILPPGGSGAWPRWSPDGARIACMHPLGIVTLDPDGSNLIIVLPEEDRSIRWEPHWSPNATHLAYTFAKYPRKGRPILDIGRCAASGDDDVLITNDKKVSFIAVGWRSE